MQRGEVRDRAAPGRAALLSLAAALALVSISGGCGSGGEGSATPEGADLETAATVVPGDVISSWNQTAQTAIVTVGAGPPTRDYLWSAIMHVAMYDAVNAVGGQGGRFVPLAASPTPRHPASREAAAIAAAYTVLSTLLPAQQATFESKYQSDLLAIPDGARKENGIAMGVEAAEQVLAAHDGVIPTVTYVPGSGPGVWQPTPPAFAIVTPGFGLVKPFTMASPSQFRPGPPPALSSDTWAADYDETKNYGGQGIGPNLATAEQRDTALLYGVEHPGAQYHRITRRIASDYGMTLSEAARFFAMVYTGFADSQIACWDAKFHYDFWRPYTAIRNGDTDGNDATVGDPEWVPLVPHPGHPEYPAAHGCFTGGFARVLEAYFGTDQVHVVIDSAPTGLAHVHEDVDDLEAEIIVARIYGGMHYRTSMDVGLEIGHSVAAQLTQSFFQPRPE